MFEQATALREVVMLTSPGQAIEFEILRDGKRSAVEVTVQAYPDRVPSLPAALSSGDRAPSMEGLKSFRGDLPNGPPVLLFFFATWCGPCKRAVPDLLTWQEDKGIPVLAITDEPEEVLNEFFTKFDKVFIDRVAIDTRGLVTDGFRARAFPTFVLLGADGTIKAVGKGSNALQQEAFK
jgi:thiol-disulfide isomerase/thioredoxin